MVPATLKVLVGGHAEPLSHRSLNLLEEVRKALPYVQELEGQIISEVEVLLKEYVELDAEVLSMLRGRIRRSRRSRTYSRR